MNEDLVKLDFIDLTDLNSSHDRFKQRRAKSTFSQKLVYDEFEYYKGMFSIFGGMTLMAAFCMKNGLIENVIEREGVEKQVYENRFGVFKALQFPKYITYEEYKANLNKDCGMDSKALMDKAKQLFIDGKNVLQRLIETDEPMRNGKYLDKQYLEKVQRIAVMNSLNLMKANMYGEKGVLKINKDQSIMVMPLIDIEQKK